MDIPELISSQDKIQKSHALNELGIQPDGPGIIMTVTRDLCN